ncbi:MAG: D-amino-acid dehydrogenase [Pseudomonadota bacterium]|nr:D-amino-acid dehydrogenase [Pseudomonadota bacterium]MDQ5904673.1 D-amino-acid dehydrogenase [Pseudomonadota bacterium]MDQ5907019.1 D-amino-acid dehydrogenase [Pseudomonadota bacterium]MDQ5918120.1 D-amino-acid dehydrogenase [Pseudomonadota bacterium]MDQ5946632.1 D-amino-acid dehydrogenase [Pseudomonadota bacterium]
MRVLVLGAGVVGVASAWYLNRAGHEVTVVDRQPGAGLETSFANGGQISVSHAEPWANPHVLPKVIKWLGREDAPLLFRLRFDAALFRWGLSFLAECSPARTRRNIHDIVAMALYSRQQLGLLRQETGIAYDQLQRGILHFYTDQRDFEAATGAAALMREFGCERNVVDADECVRIEPALAAARNHLVGGDYTAADESGDAHKFTRELATLAAASGVAFRLGASIQRIDAAGGEVSGVVVDGERLQADAYVVACGSWSASLLAPLGIRLPVYPAKGYSATLPLSADSIAPSVSLTDDGYKIVFSRLGERLRIAGTAEFNGYNTDLNSVRCAALMRRASLLFPELRPAGPPEFWCGLRPATPSNVPWIGRTRLGKLWVNTGHGTLGWTMACGSGAALADLVSGRKPEPDFPFQ